MWFAQKYFVWFAIVLISHIAYAGVIPQGKGLASEVNGAKAESYLVKRDGPGGGGGLCTGGGAGQGC